MSLFGAMNTAVSGLSAQSNAFGNISDNVANSQTVGYKRVDTSFIDYLTTSTASDNVPGSVVTRPDYVNNVEGTITQTDNPLGLAITGQGFFAVSTQAGTANNLPTFDAQQEYTRAGDFQMDKNGYLVNSAGEFLNGWPVTTDPTTGANVVHQNTLQPIQVSQSVFNPVATKNVTLSANLPATPAAGTATQAVLYQATDPDVILAENTATTATTAAAAASAQAAEVAAGDPAGDNGAAASAAVTTAVSNARTGAPTPALGAEAAYNASLQQAGLYPGTVPTLSTMVVGATRTPANPISSSIDVYDALGTMHTATLDWTQNPAPAAANTWTVNVSITGDAAFAGSATVGFGTNGLSAGTVSDLAATGGVVAGPPYNPNITAAQPATLTLNADFGSGAQPITINLGNYGGTSGLTQYAGTDYNLRGLTQDGVPPGAFSSVSTASNGDIAVNYDNGQSRVIAQVPLVTFNDPNGLQRQDGQAFTVSQDSGGPLAETANTNGAGGLVTQSVEGSNVDIATEFSKLIVAQEAYSANTKMVTTASQLLQMTIDMKQ